MLTSKFSEDNRMKRYNLVKVIQKDKEFYVLVADPRVIVKLLMNYKSGEEQETQRPWEEKRVREIAKYVSGKFKDDDNKKAIGLIPNAPILNIKEKIDVQEDDQGAYILLPETTSELEKYSNSIEAIDGQHRIRAFMEEYVDPDFSPNTTYEMIFSVFSHLSKKDKKELFMITNEKQVKVPSNLLRMFKRELDLLKGDEIIYDLVLKLNNEDYSPLKGRIMIGSKKISKGYQEIQVSKIINKSDAYKKLKAWFDDDIEKIAKVISNYIRAWEQVYSVLYQDPGKETITKVSGLRYIMYLLPTVIDILAKRGETATVANFKKIIELLPNAIDIEDVFTDEMSSLSFRGEGATIKLAKDHGDMLKSYEAKMEKKFNMAEGI